MVDRKRILDVIDQMRLAVPTDLRDAALIIEMREQIMGEAHESARRTVQQAEQERARRLEESSILREAQDRSQGILIDSEARARQVIGEADATAAAHLSEAADAATKQLDEVDQYALEIMRRLENQLGAFLESIRMSISSLQEKR